MLQTSPLLSWWQKKPCYHGAIIVIALATSLLWWLNHHFVFDSASLQQLWLARHQPENLFQHLLSYFATSERGAILLPLLTSSLSLWLFCLVARQMGIGRQTTFVLFLLLNFNPEYNAARLQINPFQVVIVLWLVSTLAFFTCKRLLHVAIVWIACAWLAVLFEPFVLIWALGFPLGLLFPAAGRRWQWHVRALTLLAYYGAIALLTAITVAFAPSVWEKILPLWDSLSSQLALSRVEMGFFISADNQFELAPFDGFLLSAALVIINELKVIGLLIIFIILFALWRRLAPIQERQIQYFCWYSLLFSCVIGALSFMYYGFLPSDLVYTPVTMLALWLISGAIFHLLQRCKSGRIRAERLLVLFWVFVAYALASMITFGPSNDYLRDSGQWARANPPKGDIFSNHFSVLYYADRSPLPDDNPNYVDLDHPLTTFYDLTGDDLVLHVQNRKKPLPEVFEQFHVIAEFINNRGDKVYALKLNNLDN